MQPQQLSIVNESTDNVPSFCEHTGDTVCSHKMGTYGVGSTLYCKGKKQITQNVDGTYKYKDISFEFNEEWFRSPGLKIELPHLTEISAFERIQLSRGILLNPKGSVKELDINNISFKEILYRLTMLALKDLKIIPNSFTQHKQYSYGVNVFEAYYRAVSGSGRIKATQKNIRWLNEQDTKQLKTKLFKTNGYRTGSHAMKYVPTEYANDIMTSVYKLFKILEFKQNDIDHKVLDFIITVEDIEQMRLRDVMLLLGDCIGYNDGFIIRPRVEDNQYSRVYSVFTSISSDTRKILGFRNYDIGAAMQTICLQLIKNTSSYPLHQELVDDKNAFRSKVQKEIGKDYDWVKKELSKIDNRDNIPKKYENYQALKIYHSESQCIRKEIISSAESLVLSRAEDHAKPLWEAFWNPVKNKYDFAENGKKESSIFFFIWTQWERQIRESMMSCFTEASACHQVHDAVYSRQKIDPKTIEKKVFEDTGFVVQISTD